MKQIQVLAPMLLRHRSDKRVQCAMCPCGWSDLSPVLAALVSAVPVLFATVRDIGVGTGRGRGGGMAHPLFVQI